MNRNSIRFLNSLLLFSVLSVSPWWNSSFASEPAKTTYADHVLPVLREKCLTCHNPEKARGGLDLSTYVKLMEGGSSGVVVKPGSPDDSRLYMLAAHKGEPKMPPNGGSMPAE